MLARAPAALVVRSGAPPAAAAAQAVARSCTLVAQGLARMVRACVSLQQSYAMTGTGMQPALLADEYEWTVPTSPFTLLDGVAALAPAFKMPYATRTLPRLGVAGRLWPLAQPPIVSGTSRRNFSTSAPPSSSERTFWVQWPGFQGSAPLTARGDMPIGFLVEDVAKELKLDAPLDSIKLQLVAMDKDGKLVTAKDARGEPLPVTLNNMDTIDTALCAAMKRPDEPKDKLRIIVDVAAPAATRAAREDPPLTTAIAAGESLRRAMLAAKPEDIVGAKSGAHLIRLAGGAEWLQLGAQPLFVRHFYEKCAAGAMDNVKPGGRFIIRGNGGIGKSSFGLYLLWREVNAGRTVVYVSDKEYYGYIFRADGRVEAFLNIDLRRMAAKVLEDRNTLLIFDGDGDSTDMGHGRPPFCKATTVLVTSPKLARYSEFEKTDVAHLVFPVFSRNEIADMLESCFPHLHDPAGRAGVWERYEKWGGIPRYVLALLRPSAQAKLDNALTAIDFDRLADVLRKNGIEDDSTVSQCLLHLKPAGETAEGFEGGDKESAYAIIRTELGSQIIAEKVYAALMQSRSDKLLALLAQPTKGTSLAKFYGDIYQRHALAKLRAGSENGFKRGCHAGDSPGR